MYEMPEADAKCNKIHLQKACELLLMSLKESFIGAETALCSSPYIPTQQKFIIYINCKKYDTQDEMKFNSSINK